jgi:hypothetical protein
VVKRPVVGSVLVVVSELESEHVVHELNSDVVSEEHNVVSGRSVCPQISLGSLRKTGVPGVKVYFEVKPLRDCKFSHNTQNLPDERGPDEAVNRLIPENSADSRVVKACEEAHHSLCAIHARKNVFLENMSQGTRAQK